MSLPVVGNISDGIITSSHDCKPQSLWGSIDVSAFPSNIETAIPLTCFCTQDAIVHHPA